MRELDIRELKQADYQAIIKEFDRVSSGRPLRFISSDDPDWLISLIEEVRSQDVSKIEVVEDNGEYVVDLYKTN